MQRIISKVSTVRYYESVPLISNDCYRVRLQYLDILSDIGQAFFSMFCGFFVIFLNSL